MFWNGCSSLNTAVGSKQILQYLQLPWNRCRRMKPLNLEKYEQIGKAAFNILCCSRLKSEWSYIEKIAVGSKCTRILTVATKLTEQRSTAISSPANTPWNFNNIRPTIRNIHQKLRFLVTKITLKNVTRLHNCSSSRTVLFSRAYAIWPFKGFAWHHNNLFGINSFDEREGFNRPFLTKGIFLQIYVCQNLLLNFCHVHV